MNNLIVSNIEETSKTVFYAVDVQFEKDGETYEANVTCILSEDENNGFDSWDITIANEDELPELTVDEVEKLEDFAKLYAQKLAS